MRIAVISDIHGNLVYLQQCLKKIATLECDRIVCLGDTVGYFPDALACMEEIQSLGCHSLMGNHEAMLVGLAPLSYKKDLVYMLAAIRNSFSEKQLSGLKQRLPFLQLTLNEKKLLFVHGSPWDPLRGYVYPDSIDISFRKLPFDVIFMGHTHRAFNLVANDILLVNVGSCGLPRDMGDSPSFAVYDSDTGEAKIYRVAVDVQAALQAYSIIHPQIRACLCRRIDER